MRHSTVTNTFTSLKAIGTFLFGNFEAFEATLFEVFFCFLHFLRLLKGEVTVVSVLFPFVKFFADAPQPLFSAESYESDLEIAEGCFRSIAADILFLCFCFHVFVQIESN